MNIKSAIKEIVRRRLAIVLVALAFGLLFLPSSQALTMDYTKKWQTDGNFAPWARSNVANVGNDQGLKLDSGASGVGTATYHFQPGLEAKWIDSSSEIDNAVLQPGVFAWITIFNKAKVSQIRAANGEIVKEWPTGNDPSRVAIGATNDIWIGNRSDFDPSGPGLKYSFSHIIPSENKVITRRIAADDGLSRHPQVVAVEPASANPERVNYIWLGFHGTAGNLMQKFKQSDFDDLATYPATLEVQDGINHYNNGVAIPPVATYTIEVPFRGTFVNYSVSDRRIYYDDQTWSGKIWCLNTVTGEHYIVDPGSAESSKGSYSVTSDRFKNVWGAGKRGWVSRINAVDKTIQYFDLAAMGLNFPFGFGDEFVSNTGITVINGAGSEKETVALSFMYPIDEPSYNKKICYSDVTNNSQTAASLDGFTCRDSSQTVAEACSSRTLGHDRGGDIWNIPINCRDVLRFNKGTAPANDYTTSELYLSTSDPGGQSSFPGDSLGNEITNTGNVINIVFSKDPIDVNNPGVSDITQVPLSRDLYVQVTFEGDPSNPPILRWLQVNYQGELGTDALIKTTYADSNREQRQFSFTAGDTVYVRLKVYEWYDNESDYKITDLVPAAVSQVTNLKYHLADGSETVLGTRTTSSGQLIFTGGSDPAFKEGINWIDYEYKI